MYEETVKRLRNIASWDWNGGDGEYVERAVKEAADAIEVLSKMEKTTRWIPVTEGLPKTRESIFGKKSSKVIVAFRFDDGTQGTDTAHTLNGEWVFEDHITVVARTITHWMPLPEPPKEVRNCDS